jgi:hypothetical protein
MFKKTIISLLIMGSFSVSAETYKFNDMSIEINSSYNKLSLSNCKKENCSKIEIKTKVVIDSLKKDIEMYDAALSDMEKVFKTLEANFQENSKIESKIFVNKKNKIKFVEAKYEDLTLSFPIDSSKKERVEYIERYIEYGKKSVEMSLKTIENNDFPLSFETENYKEYRTVYKLFRMVSRISKDSKK